MSKGRRHQPTPKAGLRDVLIVVGLAVVALAVIMFLLYRAAMGPIGRGPASGWERTTGPDGPHLVGYPAPVRSLSVHRMNEAGSDAVRLRDLDCQWIVSWDYTDPAMRVDLFYFMHADDAAKALANGATALASGPGEQRAVAAGLYLFRRGRITGRLSSRDPAATPELLAARADEFDRAVQATYGAHP
ncbi:MAG: hypothetical protein KBD01_12835 [Acidobacteria bacterium]|nr:hypothetical protein [Acidobacteriota bacterium]